ncbi:MAG: hypothetical protein ACYCTW_12875 [Sulfuricella sp.]
MIRNPTIVEFVKVPGVDGIVRVEARISRHFLFPGIQASFCRTETEQPAHGPELER